jgi:hypothetical protein
MCWAAPRSSCRAARTCCYWATPARTKSSPSNVSVSLECKSHVALALGLGLAVCPACRSFLVTTASTLSSELIKSATKAAAPHKETDCQLRSVHCDELGFVPLPKIGTELLLDSFNQRTSAVPPWSSAAYPSPSVPKSSTPNAHRSAARPPHPPRPHPGGERR